jgi:hypothetical protein
MTETLGIIGFAIALVVTPVYLVLLVKGVRSLSDIRDLFKRLPGDYGDGGVDRDEGRKRGQLN